MKQDISWNKLLVEAFVIVGSILLAFAIDAWWDNRELGIWEEIQLEALHQEFTVNFDLLEFVGERMLGSNGVNSIFEFANQGSNGSSQVFSNYELASLIAWRTRELSTATLDALLTSGDLGKLRNSELRRQLTALKALIEDSQEKEALALEFIEFVITPTLLGQDILTPAYMARPGYLTRAPQENVLITWSPKLRDLAAVRLGHSKMIQYSQVNVRSAIIEILAQIEIELGDNTPEFGALLE